MTKKSESALPSMPSEQDVASLTRFGLDHLREWERVCEESKSYTAGVQHLQAAYLAARAVERVQKRDGALPPPFALFVRRCYAAMDHYAGTFFKSPDARGTAAPLRTRRSVADTFRADYRATRLQQVEWDAGKRKTDPRSSVADKVNERAAKALGVSVATVHRARVKLLKAHRPPPGVSLENWLPPSAEERQWVADLKLMREVEAWQPSRPPEPVKSPKREPHARPDFSFGRHREKR